MQKSLNRDHTQSKYSQKGKEGFKAKAYIYCFDEAILLFKSVHEGVGV